jgi:transposase
MVEYIQGIPRDQIHLFVASLDELIDENHIVRFIDAYVDSLNMEGLGFETPMLRTGAQAYSEQLKLKIYIYGYFEKIRSSRRLEKECLRNKELIWLTEGLAPDFKTIADFRKDNSKAFRKIFKEFLTLCHKLELLSFDTVAIDGTKFRGQNSLNEVYKKERMKKIEAEIQERIDRYLKELDEIDHKEQEAGVSINQERIMKITGLLSKQMSRLDKIKIITGLFESDPELNIYYATDEDCRLQSDKGKIRAGFNPQTAVEEKNKLIVVADVTNEQNDIRQLTPMIEQVKEIKAELGVTGKTNGIADAGYFSEKGILANLNQENINIVVSQDAENKKIRKEKESDKIPAKGFEQKDFNFDNEKDVFVCPQGHELIKINNTPRVDRHGKDVDEYKCDSHLCNSCPHKAKCTNSENGRMLKVSVNNEAMRAYLEGLKTDENKFLIRERKELVEHPFGTIKKTFGYTYFLLKGLKKVKAEFSFICFIYNLKRVLNIVPMDQLLSTIKGVMA